MNSISIIIPVLNESKSLEPFLHELQVYRNDKCEIIVVDGGSSDETCQIAKKYCDKLLVSDAGRAKQMNLGASHSSGSVLLFLHADTILPSHFFELISDELRRKNKSWGRFDINLSGKHFMFRIVENLINIRSSISGISTGDQAIFVKNELFIKIGGFPEIPLMEDVAISKKLKKSEMPLCVKTRVVTSSRRWEQYGIWKTIFLMWRLRLGYFLGIDPQILKKKYL